MVLFDAWLSEKNWLRRFCTTGKTIDLERRRDLKSVIDTRRKEGEVKPRERGVFEGCSGAKQGKKCETEAALRVPDLRIKQGQVLALLRNSVALASGAAARITEKPP